MENYAPLAHDVIDGIIKEAKAGLDKILKDKPNGSISLRAQAAME
ncbi:hypothetical protein PS847_01941 [Pseudomonas fluorescens]|uniref:Uncharacterized protein n=1 Tax=Pseudomonas fluorescens TaxID=294 RepID=A0A5E7J726_PSEFL|nr:hypothetical protein PS847_01941 [Pseudomonas fluorescens]